MKKNVAKKLAPGPNRFEIVAYTEKGSRLAWETRHREKAMPLSEFADALERVAASVRALTKTEQPETVGAVATTVEQG